MHCFLERRLDDLAVIDHGDYGLITCPPNRIIDTASVQRLWRPGEVEERLGLPVRQVLDVLRELEQRMTFLFRNAAGEVVWAYQVTADQTPHRMYASSGERLYAA